jgi:hypothetical protein
LAREKSKNSKFFANLKNNSPRKTPFSRECKFGRVLGFGDLGKPQCSSGRSDSFLRFGTRRKKIAGKTTTNNYRHRLFFYDFLQLRYQWVGPLEDCQKKHLLLPTIAFPGIGSSAEGKGLKRSDVEGIERSAEVFFSYFGCGYFVELEIEHLYRIDEDLGD